MCRNTTNLKFALIFLSVAAISCAAVREFGDRTSEKTRRLNESVPAGMGSAEQDHRIHDVASFKIVLPEAGQILLGDADAEPTDLASLGPLLELFAETTAPDRRVVFLIAAVHIPTADVAAVLDKVRELDIKIVKLVTSGRPLDEDRGMFSKIPPPDRAIEVVVRKEVMTYRPNPLTLLVTTGPDGRLFLNAEPQEDLDDLIVRLSEVFKQREATGVFRENTNEVEKTVLVDVPRTDPNQKYGELVKVVNALKLAAAQPIVLGDKNELIRMPEGLRDSELDLRPPTLRFPASTDSNKKEPPKTISGGVLNGKAIELPKPPYPPAARSVRASGAVSVQVLVGRDGNVESAAAVSGHPLLRPAAVQAARSARFAPTLLSGQPVSVSGVLTYNFVP